MSRTRRILIATPVPGKSGWTGAHLDILRMHCQTKMQAVADELCLKLGASGDDTFEFILADAAWHSAGSAIGRSKSRFEEWNDYVATGVDIWGDPNFDAVLVPGGPNWPGANADYCVGKATGNLLYTCITNSKPVFILHRDGDDDTRGVKFSLRPGGIHLDVNDEDSWTHYASLLPKKFDSVG